MVKLCAFTLQEVFAMFDGAWETSPGMGNLPKVGRKFCEK